MPFIGNQPALSYTSFAVQHFTTSATTSYTLDYSVANENEIRLVINNVVQQPGSSYAYTASGTTLTLSAATSATDTMYAVFLGKAVQTVTPASGSVTNAMLAGSIDLTSKVTGTLPVANGGTGLTSGFNNGISVAEEWKISSGVVATSTTSGTFTSPTFYDGLGGSAQMTQSSGIFTFPSTGYYLITFLLNVFDNGEDHRQFANYIYLSTDSGTSYSVKGQGQNFIEHTSQGSNTHMSTYAHAILDITNTSTHRVKFQYFFTGSSLSLYGDNQGTSATFLRLGDT